MTGADSMISSPSDASVDYTEARNRIVSGYAIPSAVRSLVLPIVRKSSRNLRGNRPLIHTQAEHYSRQAAYSWLTCFERQGTIHVRPEDRRKPIKSSAS
jgi:hypothetical protein